MASSSYVNISITASDQEFMERVRGCIASIRSNDPTPTTGKDASEQAINDANWLPYWMWRIAADNSILSRYWGSTGMGASPPNEDAGIDTSVISDTVLLTAVKTVLGV